MGIRILHAADLHLTASEERAYSLAVLDELIARAEERSVDALVLAGDLFDSFADVEALRSEVRERMSGMKAEVVFVPGNHEVLRAAGKSIDQFDFGRIRVLNGTPYQLTTIETTSGVLEILAVPHQPDYATYREWSVPEKQAPHRVAVAHGVVTGMNYWAEAVMDEEDRAAVMDPDLFVRFQVDYAALGHVHNPPPPKTIGSTTIAYPGSARVWRKGESGPRRALLVDLDDPTRFKADVLGSAGLYLNIETPLDLDGSPPRIDHRKWQETDFIELVLTGLVDEESQARAATKQLQKELGKLVRKLEVDRSGIQVLAGIAEEPVARRFLEVWQAAQPEPGTEAHADWTRARQIGLEVLKSRLENRR